MSILNRREALASLAGAVSLEASGVPRAAMREVNSAIIVTVAQDPSHYMHCPGIAAFDDELVCVYRKCDAHLASAVEIWSARSKDGGRTWTDHQFISRAGWEPDRETWVVPQLGKTRDGRLLMIVDRGKKKHKMDWPLLAQWQMKDRGMSNHLFVSADRGRTWQGPVKIDDVGGEPSYIVELANGNLFYTRTDSKPTNAFKHPTLPWGANYYRSTGVFSADKGKTWGGEVVVADSPLHSDCEVGVVEYAPGKLLGVSKVGDGNGRYGHPSRFLYSDDSGKTWTRHNLSPYYGQRAIVHKLASGKVLLTYRNVWGTTASYAALLDPAEKMEYQPNSFIWDESRCVLRDGVLEIKTAEGTPNAVEFVFYPVEDEDSQVEMEFELCVKSADERGCTVSAGAWVGFTPGRIAMIDRPGEHIAFDTTNWHRYRLVNSGKTLALFADGKLLHESKLDGIHSRYVRLGNRLDGVYRYGKQETATRDAQGNYIPPVRGGMQYVRNASHSLWRGMSFHVKNRRDYSIQWAWDPRKGYPDQFRRDRIVRLERNASFIGGDGGYSSIAQRRDGMIVVADYTPGPKPFPKPVIRAYLLKESELS